jgi:hypothetical protein
MRTFAEYRAQAEKKRAQADRDDGNSLTPSALQALRAPADDCRRGKPAVVRPLHPRGKKSRPPQVMSQVQVQVPVQVPVQGQGLCPTGGALRAMLPYRFELRNNSGRRVEDLGFMELVDDGEALAFGKQVIFDLVREDRNYAGWIMDIIEGKRPVATVALE